MHDWQSYIDKISKQIVKIEVQSGWGTGFVHYGRTGGTRCIATARHVVAQVVEEKQPFRVWHGKRVTDFGKGAKDAVFVQRNDADVDSAVLAVIDHDLPMPLVSLADQQERRAVCVGTEVGWLGFPSLLGITGQLCFFSGRISCLDARANRFFIDGTVVQGCSGGPVFCITANGPRIIGAITDIIPNCNSLDEGGYLPGLVAAVDVSNYKPLEQALDQMPNRERSLTIKLDECPKCGGRLTEQVDTSGQPDIICQSGCGALIDLLDSGFVRNAPGGSARLKDIIIEHFRLLAGRS